MTGSATPLGWTRAQFVRLAWSIDAGRPVERPDVVSCRYGGPYDSAEPRHTPPEARAAVIPAPITQPALAGG